MKGDDGQLLKFAISGKARSGKTTLAEALMEYFGDLDFVNLESFAEPLRSLADSAVLTKADSFYRPILQGVGDFARGVCEDFFVEGLARRLAYKLDHLGENYSGMAVIHDLRFPNEARWCREHGFILVRVECPEALRKSRYGNDELFDKMKDHVSETALDDWDDWDVMVRSTLAPVDQNAMRVVEYLKLEEQL